MKFSSILAISSLLGVVLTKKASRLVQAMSLQAAPQTFNIFDPMP